MSDQQLIEIKAKSKTGAVVTFHVLEILEIDGQPLAFGTDDLRTVLAQIAERLAAVERHTGMTTGD